MRWFGRAKGVQLSFVFKLYPSLFLYPSLSLSLSLALALVLSLSLSDCVSPFPQHSSGGCKNGVISTVNKQEEFMDMSFGDLLFPRSGYTLIPPQDQIPDPQLSPTLLGAFPTYTAYTRLLSELNHLIP